MPEPIPEQHHDDESWSREKYRGECKVVDWDTEKQMAKNVIQNEAQCWNPNKESISPSEIHGLTHSMTDDLCYSENQKFRVYGFIMEELSYIIPHTFLHKEHDYNLDDFIFPDDYVTL